MKKISENDLGDYHVTYLPNIIAIMIFSMVVIVGFLVTTGLGEIVDDHLNLDNSSCHNITVNDTFSEISGSGLGRAYTHYYVVSDNIVYEMTINGNATEIYRWTTIIKGQPYNVKTYKAMAQFCDHPSSVWRKP